MLTFTKKISHFYIYHGPAMFFLLLYLHLPWKYHVFFFCKYHRKFLFFYLLRNTIFYIYKESTMFPSFIITIIIII